MKKYSEEWLKEKELKHQVAMERKVALRNESSTWNGEYKVGAEQIGNFLI